MSIIVPFILCLCYTG